MKKWLFNPFTYLAGAKALLLGLTLMLVTAIGAYFGNMHFNAAIDAHFGPAQPFVIYLFEQLIAWGCPVVIFYLMALLVSKSNFRFIDIAGTLAIARTPMLLIVIIALLSKSYMQALKPGTIDNTVMVLGLVMLLPVIWMIALMYNAFKVAVNVKGTKAIIGFIVGLILAEIASILLNQVLQNYFNH
ncbi:MAG: hypothetical protein EOP46_18210 [Sphingobacteriaceae bacterium]|nr:MAG: hypothetical protein EOP46_18210 [Sphingobacteriaceae bacterium]